MPEPTTIYERLRRAGIASWSLAGIFVVAGIFVWLLIQF